MASERGKRIDTWEFSINHVKVSVVVKMRANCDRRQTSEFFVRDDSYSLSESDTDINALKQRVESHLIEHLRVAWEPYFYIEFRADLPVVPDPDDEPDDEGDGFGVNVDANLKVQQIEIGTKPDGTKCWRVYSKYGGVRSQDGEPETGSEKDRWGARECQRCLVPASPSNRDTIDGLRNAILSIHERLFGLLDPEDVDLGKAADVVRSFATT